MLRTAFSASLMVLLGIGATAAAQSKVASGRTIVHSVIVEQPRGDGFVVEKVPPGVVIEVLGQRGDWYQVSLLNDRDGVVRPSGWMHRDAVELMRGQTVARMPEPVGESPRRGQDATRAFQNAEPARMAQRSARSGEFEPLAPNRGWVDVNFVSMRSRQEEETYSLAFPQYGEVGAAVAIYPALPDLKGLEAAAGVQLASSFGLGVHVDFADYQSAVGLGVSIPHPYYFNRSGFDADVAALERKDRAIDIHATYIAPMPAAVAVRLFVGPTYFYTKQDMVQGILYDQFATIFSTSQIVDIRSAPRETISGSVWGFNAGADVSYFFTRYVGLGGVVRVNHGTLKATDPLSGEDANVALGAVTIGGGVRFRF